MVQHTEVEQRVERSIGKRQTFSATQFEHSAPVDIGRQAALGASKLSRIDLDPVDLTRSELFQEDFNSGALAAADLQDPRPVQPPPSCSRSGASYNRCTRVRTGLFTSSLSTAFSLIWRTCTSGST